MLTTSDGFSGGLAQDAILDDKESGTLSGLPHTTLQLTCILHFAGTSHARPG